MRNVLRNAVLGFVLGFGLNPFAPAQQAVVPVGTCIPPSVHNVESIAKHADGDDCRQVIDPRM